MDVRRRVEVNVRKFRASSGLSQKQLGALNGASAIRP
jgi:hypothetical protein